MNSSFMQTPEKRQNRQNKNFRRNLQAKRVVNQAMQ